MKKLLSLFLVLVTLLGILPTAAFAADSEEEALGEVNIYNGEYELGYLSINGSVRKQIYTYFLYSIAPIAAARCMSTAPTTASAFLNTPAHSTPKFLAERSARPSTVSMKMWYCPLSLKC